MPDDPIDWVMRWLWPGADSSTRRAYRSGLLGVQGAPGVGGGNGGVAADAGSVEATGVAGQTKGGSVSDDREARRLAVEAAARTLVERWGVARDDELTAAGMALRAAVRRLDAPRYEIAVFGTKWCVVLCDGMEYDQAKRAAALLNDAEGK